MKKVITLFLLFLLELTITSAIGVWYTQAHNVTLSDFQTIHEYAGMQILVTGGNASGINVSKLTADTSTTCKLHINSTSVIILASGTFDGNYCFINYPLNDSTAYVVNTFTNGVTDRKSYYGTSVTYAIQDSKIKWMSGILGSEANNVLSFINSIATGVVSISINMTEAAGTPAPTFTQDNPYTGTYLTNVTPRFWFQGTDLDRVDLVINGSRYGSTTNPSDSTNTSILANASLTIGREYIWRFDYTGDDASSNSGTNKTFFLAGVYPVLSGFSISNACYVTASSSGYYVQK